MPLVCRNKNMNLKKKLHRLVLNTNPFSRPYSPSMYSLGELSIVCLLRMIIQNLFN